MRLAIVALCAGLLLGWLANGWRLGEQIAEIRADHAGAIKAEQERARKIETGWHAGINEVQKNARAKHEELAAHLSDADAAADRLRKQVAELSRRPAACPSVANGSASAETVARVFAELLGELDGMAGAYAEEAGRTRIAGTACEVAYDLVSGEPALYSR